MPAVFITGASRGIGRETALRLARAGWTVHAGVRRETDGETLASEHGSIRPVLVDVADESSVAGLETQLPDRLDALVNNAGVVVAGPVEALPVADLRRQLEINVVGQIAVTQACLSRLRIARGRIVFISSISGRVVTPLTGAYAASKFAVEALADALRLELRPWSVDVTLIEPGAIDTDIWRNIDATTDEAEAALSPEHRTLYAPHVAGMRKVTPRMRKGASPASKVAEAIEDALTAKRAPARTMVGLDAKAQLLLSRLPTRAADAAIAKSLGL